MKNIISVKPTSVNELLAAYAMSQKSTCLLAIMADGSEPASVIRQLLTELQENTEDTVMNASLDQLEEITLLEVNEDFGRKIISVPEYTDWLNMSLFVNGKLVAQTEH